VTGVLELATGCTQFTPSLDLGKTLPPRPGPKKKKRASMADKILLPHDPN